MGFKSAFMKIWKILWAGLFAAVGVFGIMMILGAKGIINFTAEFADSQLFWGIGFTVVGVLFGFLPLLKTFKTAIKFALSILGLFIFAWGLCATLTYYVDSINISWAQLPHDIANWLSIVILFIGLIGGVIPFFKTIKNVFSKE